jgi:hypothetical protein
MTMADWRFAVPGRKPPFAQALPLVIASGAANAHFADKLSRAVSA